MGSDYTIWAAIIPYGQLLYNKKVGIIGYYKICCVLLVVFIKLLYANGLTQRWAKLLLYLIQDQWDPSFSQLRILNLDELSVWSCTVGRVNFLFSDYTLCWMSEWTSWWKNGLSDRRVNFLIGDSPKETGLFDRIVDFLIGEWTFWRESRLLWKLNTDY